MTQTVKLIAFPGAPNLPIFVAQEKGWFEKHNVALDMTLTPNSAYQAEAMAKGEFDIAGTAFDNVVAYTEGQGAVALPETPDFFAFLGATQIELAVVAQPDAKSIGELKGKALALDAPGTGFAFVFYHMLATGGLKPGDYGRDAVGATPSRWESVKAGKHAATMTIEPFTSIAKGQGFQILARSTDSLRDYQGGVFMARRSWAGAHREAVVGFTRAYLDGLAFTLDPANREEATAILLRNMADIRPQVAGSVMTSLLSPRSGLTPGGAVTIDGIRTVLELRTRYGKGRRDAQRSAEIYRSVLSQRGWRGGLNPPLSFSRSREKENALMEGERSIRRNVALDRRAQHQAALIARKIRARVGRAAVVPKQHVADAPFVRIDERGLLRMIEHPGEKRAGLPIRHAFDADGHQPVDVGRLAAGLVMRAEEGMLGLRRRRACPCRRPSAPNRNCNGASAVLPSSLSRNAGSSVS